jgi:hypothetical protein
MDNVLGSELMIAGLQQSRYFIVIQPESKSSIKIWCVARAALLVDGRGHQSCTGNSNRTETMSFL